MSWTIANPLELVKQAPDAPLSSAHLQQKLVSGSVDSPAVTTNVPGLSGSVSTGAEVDVESFTSPSDSDELGVVGASGTPEDATLTPALVMGETDAWLKYEVAANVKVTAAEDFPFIGASVDGQREVVVADYHRHAKSENTRKAILADAAKLRFPMAAGELDRLGVGEAFTIQTKGSVTAQLILKWSDVFSTNVGDLLGLLKGSPLLVLKADVNANVSAKVTVSDGFVLVFSRPAAGKIKIGLRKAQGHGFSAAAQLGVSAHPDTDAINAALGGVVDSVLGMGWAELDKLLVKSQRTPEEAEAVQRAMERLGTSASSDTSLVHQAYEALKKAGFDALWNLVQAKAEAGFTYEYTRLEEGATLLELTLSDEEAKALHLSLLRGDVSHVIAEELKKQRRPDRYLRQDTYTSEQAWGFSLSFSRWELIASHDDDKLTAIVTRDLSGNVKLAYAGVRGYSGKLFDWSAQWGGDLKADQRVFLPSPTAADLHFGLHLNLRRTLDDRSERSLRVALDEAIVWRVFADGDEEAALEELKSLAKLGKPIEARLELRTDDGVTRAMLASVGSDVAVLDALFARALARALPWMNYKCRRIVEVREAVYAPLWAAFLRDGHWSPGDAARTVGMRLRRDPIGKEIADVEGMVGGYTGVARFAEVVQAYPGTAGEWTDFRDGLLLLRDGIAQSRAPDFLAKAYGGLKSLWAQSFHLRAVGAFWTAVAAKARGTLDGVERTLTVTSGDQTRVFSSSGHP